MATATRKPAKKPARKTKAKPAAKAKGTGKGEPTRPDVFDEQIDKRQEEQAAAIAERLETLELVEEAEAEVAEAEEKLTAAREHAKKLKSIFDGKVAELRQLLQDSKNPPPLVKYAKEQEAKRKAEANGKQPTADLEAEAAQAEADRDAEAWRGALISATIGSAEVVGKDKRLGPALVKNLAEAGMSTLGELCDKRGNESEQWFTQSVKGFGPAASTKLDDALEAYWTWRKQQADQAKAEEGVESDETEAKQDDKQADDQVDDNAVADDAAAGQAGEAGQ